MKRKKMYPSHRDAAQSLGLITIGRPVNLSLSVIVKTHFPRQQSQSIRKETGIHPFKVK